MKHHPHPAVALLALLLAACGPAEHGEPVRGQEVPVYGYKIVNTYPHDPRAFTQGLQYHDGFIYESTGLYGQSSLRKVDYVTGRVERRVDLPARYFGEGIAVVDDRIYMLTWKEQTGFIFDRETFRRIGTFTYAGEGWGLAFDGTHLILSDGTPQLRFFERETFALSHTRDVTAAGQPAEGLNELAWIGGELWANVFKTDRLARIDPATGNVVAWIDLHGLLDPRYVTGRIDVLNGIAYDERTRRIFVTGKLWPHLFEIKVVPPRHGKGRS